MPRVVVFKGGTAFNSFLPRFHKAFPKTSYIIPVSDDGGSSREIVRVFGGPGIGDIRSTLTRLSDASTEEAKAVKSLLELRLSPTSSEAAYKEWRDVLEGTHPYWETMTTRFKGLIHGFLRHFEAERLKEIQKKFDLRNGSIGNFFFTGARLLFGSLATPIFIYSSVTSIPETTKVFPVVDSNEPICLAALLTTQDILIGQSAISHPRGGPVVDKEGCNPLPGRIKNIFYANKYGDRIRPKMHREALASVEEADALIYGIGSFWTSIMPSLVFPELGEALAKKRIPKIFMLNSYTDRETGGMTAQDCLQAIYQGLSGFEKNRFHLRDFVTHLFVVKGSGFPVSHKELQKEGIEIVEVDKSYRSLVFEGKSYPKYKYSSLEAHFHSLF